MPFCGASAWAPPQAEGTVHTGEERQVRRIQAPVQPDETMKKTILHRLFGAGSVPGDVRAALEREGGLPHRRTAADRHLCRRSPPRHPPCDTPAERTLRFSFESSDFREGWHGVMDFHFRTDKAHAFFRSPDSPWGPTRHGSRGTAARRRRLKPRPADHIRSSVRIPSSPRPSRRVSAVRRQRASREPRAGSSALSTGTWS